MEPREGEGHHLRELVSRLLFLLRVGQVERFPPPDREAHPLLVLLGLLVHRDHL